MIEFARDQLGGPKPVSMLIGLLITLHPPLVASVNAQTAAKAPILHTVTADGHPLALWEKRPAKPRRAIMLIHGRTWSTLPDFDLQVPGESLSLMDGLVAEGYATYGLDLRGYGRTPRDSTGWNTPDRVAADAAIALEWIASHSGVTGKPVLFGLVLGSMVSQLTAQRRPDLVSSVILFGYPTDPDTRTAVQPDTGQPARRATTAENAASDFRTPGTISELALKTYVAAALHDDPVRTDWRRLHQWNALDPAQVKVPTLLIQGELDPLAKTDAHAKFFARLGTPDREWVVIPGGDHAALLETTRARFIQAIVSFQERAGAAGAAGKPRYAAKPAVRLDRSPFTAVEYFERATATGSHHWGIKWYWSQSRLGICSRWLRPRSGGTAPGTAAGAGGTATT